VFDVANLIRRPFALCARGALIAVLAAAPPLVGAETLQLNPDHPERYTVQKGDTLWDISARFLSEPWRWPEIWEDNPQVRNPDLIYPGDELVLTYSEGRPVLRRVRNGVVKLSPSVRATSLEGGAIPPIPVDAIAQFLSRPRVVTQAQIDNSPYVVSVGAEHLVAGAGSQLFVRGLDSPPARQYGVYRQGDEYRNPKNPEESLGFEAIHVGDAVLRATGDPATMMLTASTREVLIGDRLLPVEDDETLARYVPRSPSKELTGSVISVAEGVSQVGEHQVVVLNLGERDGIEPGHVLVVYQRGEEVIDPLARSPKGGVPEPEAYIERDPDKQGGADGLSIAADRLVRAIQDVIVPEGDSYKRVRLPDQRAGVVMVFRRFERVSYALVMNAERAIHLDDTVRTP